MIKQKKKIFINIQDDYDISMIVNGLKASGYDYHRELIIPGDEDGIIRACEGCVGVVSRSETWNDRTLQAVKDHVRVIMRYGIGYDNINVSAATNAGIAVFNAAGCSSRSVAEVALLHILNIGRRFTESIERVKNGEDTFIPDIGCYELANKVIGLYGAGSIACELAKLLVGFNVHVIAYDIVRNKEIEKYNVKFVSSPEELFKMSDYVSIHIPCNATTKGIVNASLLNLMKPGAALINTARGSIINDDDMINALRNGRIRAVGFDVLQKEPICKDNIYQSVKNAWITPHIGASTYEAKSRVEKLIYTTLVNYLNGAYNSIYPPNYINPPSRR